MLHQLLRRGDRVIITPADLKGEAINYFEWAEQHPLIEEKVFHSRGIITRAEVDRPRTFSRRGLALYLGITTSQLAAMGRRGPEWAALLDLIDNVIYEHKFAHAAVGLMNASLIARDLGLTEKQETVVSSPGGAPIQFNIQPIQTGTFLPPDENNK